MLASMKHGKCNRAAQQCVTSAHYFVHDMQYQFYLCLCSVVCYCFGFL